MSNIREAYDEWAEQYDTNTNKTRDIEAYALKQTLGERSFTNILEVGCGTGKNTSFLADRTQQMMCVDLSEEMLRRAKLKSQNGKIHFQIMDITNTWTVGNTMFDLITFSLILEHIASLDHVFSETVRHLMSGGFVYIGELHPFKQYSGSKARYEKEGSVQEVTCFTHHLSDFTLLAKKYDLTIVEVDEYFDDDNRENLPRIFTMLLRKNTNH
jgi:ubiquinone/menaquinone biosynthesis C-methylase UbiE